MFDDWVEMAIFVVVVAGIGWIVGIVGFFRAGSALRQVASLRAAMAQASRTADITTVAAAPPQPLPTEPIVPATVPLTVELPFAETDSLPTSAAPDPDPVLPERRRFDIEELLTARWGVWLGSAALLLAGVFLVRYAAEEGLLGPAVRCLAMAVLGGALIAGALMLARRPVRGLPYPDQVPAALGAGGVAILFGAAYASSVVYALVPALAGLVLMAAVSLLGLLVSLRLGQLVAAIGLVGAFATPALVQTETPSLPGLFAYLLFVAAAALAVVRYAAWVWLAWATVIAGAAWVVLATLSGPDAAEWAPALFVPALAALHLSLLPGAALDHPIGRKLAWVPVACLGAVGLLLAIVDPETVTRVGVLLIAPVTLVAAAREPRLARLPWVAALLFLLLVGLWGLPPWTQTGEAVYVDGNLLAVLPGDWTPEALRPFLLTTFGMSALFAVAGLLGERRLARPLAWSALVAGVPVLALAVAYARVQQFQPDAMWAGTALLLAAFLTGVATLAARAGERQRAGVHAAGATAALALGFAMLLTGQWLTIALVLLLPPLMWIEAQADLAPLRRVALCVAAVVLGRLLLNNQVLDYVDLQPPVLNGRALAYLVAAVSFAVTARMARRRVEDTLVEVLQFGSAAFVTALIALEIRQWASGGQPGSPDISFTEIALQVSALALQATAARWLGRRTGRGFLDVVWGVQGGLALLGGIGLILGNPLLVDGQSVGSLPLLDALLPAYLLPALLAARASRDPRNGTGLQRILGLYALLAAFTWVTLEVRHIAHPDAMGIDEAPIYNGELWAWSGAWMALAIALMTGGVLARRRDLRLAALAVMLLVTVKVFLLDMAGLDGLWRVLSFLALGLTLIALGKLYGRLAKNDADQPAQDVEPAA